eukprot:6068932-Ditylum_brightwellii.AAC.1
MITEHTAAIIIQTHFWLFHQQHALQDNNLTMPTREPPASAVRKELLMMLCKMQDNLNQDIQEM